MAIEAPASYPAIVAPRGLVCTPLRPPWIVDSQIVTSDSAVRGCRITAEWLGPASINSIARESGDRPQNITRSPGRSRERTPLYCVSEFIWSVSGSAGQKLCARHREAGNRVEVAVDDHAIEG